MTEHHRVHCLVVGSGEAEEEIDRIFHEAGVGERLHRTGSLQGQKLIDAYHAMDLFAMASTSETQGLVVAEAMAACLPVVALDASGIREVVDHRSNGRLVFDEDIESFSRALGEMATLEDAGRRKLIEKAMETADAFSMPASTREMIRLYEKACGLKTKPRDSRMNIWRSAMEQLQTEWNLLSNVADAAVSSLVDPKDAS